MASIALHLRSRPRPFLRPFSSSSSSSSSSTPNNVTPPNPENTETNPNPKSSFSDLKSHLKNPQQQQQQQQQQPPRNPFSFSQRSPPNPNLNPNPNINTPTMSIDDIRNNLRDFRLRSAPQPISFQELYKKNISDTSSSSSPPLNSISSIREQLRKKSPNADSAKSNNTAPLSLSRFKETFRARPGDAQEVSSRFVGGTSGSLPLSIFGKELRAKSRRPGEAAEEDDLGSALARDYTYEELGKRLRELRPDDGVKGFSVSELTERLVKLREIESKEEVKGGGGLYSELRKTIQAVQISDSRKNLGFQGVGLVNHLNGTPNYMLTPPEEHLVEKYFHPDNMSSAEKLKIELKRVRDEFKMSETDCGSTRVQIAQLTTEISHLSKVLHKKDKHSRKGLIAKVQLRKKLLKYLRRTDWDSYCFILSKLELRDNPGYKQLPSKKT